MMESLPGVLSVIPPAGEVVPVVFDSPHSGKAYPDDFGSVLPPGALRAAEDAFVERLFAAAPERGATLLAAEFPRSYIDPNRPLTDLDPDLIEGRWPGPLIPSDKTLKLGSGLIWRTCYPDLPMYDRKLTVDEVRRRIDRFWRPYHAALAHLIEGAHRRFGCVWHVNCHSMPSVSSVKSPEGPGHERPDFVLGDRDGATCAPEFTGLVRSTLAGMGYRVTVNDPYKGVELVRAYSDPAAGRHSLQVEIKRALYMDEAAIAPHGGFDRLRADLTRLIEVICDFARTRACAFIAPEVR